MVATDAPEILSIGVIFGGSPEIDTLWLPETRRVMKSVISHREGVTSPLCLNIVFQIEGRLLPPVEFEGVRSGRLSRKRMELMVQAAVPKEPVLDRRASLLELLRCAVVVAEDVARRKKIANDLPGIRKIVEAVALEGSHT